MPQSVDNNHKAEQRDDRKVEPRVHGYPGGVLILGMHRSGTSLLTGTLEQLGVQLGEVRVASKYNLKGNRESVSVQRFHDRLLGKNGASWCSPPAGQCRWDREDFHAASELLEGIARRDEPWGFKDPRTVFTLEGWLKLVESPRLVAMVRPQEDVVRSLGLRGQVSLDHEAGVELWVRYNEELLRLARRYRFPVLPFPVNEAQRAHFFRDLSLLADHWGLAQPDDADFFDASLIHHRSGLGADAGDALYDALIGSGKTNLSKLLATR